MADLKDFKVEDETLDEAAGGAWYDGGSYICSLCGAKFLSANEVWAHEETCPEKDIVNFGRRALGLPEYGA